MQHKMNPTRPNAPQAGLPCKWAATKRTEGSKKSWLPPAVRQTSRRGRAAGSRWARRLLRRRRRAGKRRCRKSEAGVAARQTPPCRMTTRTWSLSLPSGSMTPTRARAATTEPWTLSHGGTGRGSSSCAWSASTPPARRRTPSRSSVTTRATIHCCPSRT